MEDNITLLYKYKFPIKCIRYVQRIFVDSRYVINQSVDTYIGHSVNAVSNNLLHPTTSRYTKGDTTELNYFVDADNREFYIERTANDATVFDLFPKHWTLYLLEQ